MRCEGWTRKGCIFSMGLPTWSQCKNEAVVMLKVEQEKVEKQPACMDCWNKGIEKGIKILSVEPIKSNKLHAADTKERAADQLRWEDNK